MGAAAAALSPVPAPRGGAGTCPRPTWSSRTTRASRRRWRRGPTASTPAWPWAPRCWTRGTTLPTRCPQPRVRVPSPVSLSLFCPQPRVRVPIPSHPRVPHSYICVPFPSSALVPILSPCPCPHPHVPVPSSGFVPILSPSPYPRPYFPAPAGSPLSPRSRRSSLSSRSAAGTSASAGRRRWTGCRSVSAARRGAGGVPTPLVSPRVSQFRAPPCPSCSEEPKNAPSARGAAQGGRTPSPTPLPAP